MVRSARRRARKDTSSDAAGQPFDDLLRLYEQLNGPVSNEGDAVVLTKRMLVLLRCCLCELTRMGHDLGEVLEKCRVFMLVLRGVQECCFPAECGVRCQGMLPPFAAIAILEVFLESLVKHRELRRHFAATECYDCSSVKAKIFVSEGCLGDLHVIDELVSWHFILSAYSEQAFDRALHPFSWIKESDCMNPELCLDAALFLVRTAHLSNAPCFILAHLLRLSIKCIPIDSVSSNIRDFANCISAFELSFKLYEKYMPEITGFASTAALKGHLEYASKMSAFSSSVSANTYDALNSKIAEIDFCKSNSSQVSLSVNHADTFSRSFGFIPALYSSERFRQDAAAFMEKITSSIISQGGERSDAIGIDLTPEILCLAASLKLMSSSLIYALRFITIDSPGSHGDVKSDEYKYLLETVECFENYGADRLVYNNLLNALAKDHEFKSAPMSMLEHFTRLANYSQRMNFSLLWEGSIAMMMVAIKLLDLQSGGFDKLRFLYSRVEEYIHVSSYSGSQMKAVSLERSSATATCFITTQRTYMTKEIICGTNFRGSLPQSPGRDDAVEGRCNGSAFIKCFSKVYKNSGDWDGLEDFIVCKEGKDYDKWLQKKESYRKWKQKKKHSKKLLLKRHAVTAPVGGAPGRKLRWLRRGRAEEDGCAVQHDCSFL